MRTDPEFAALYRHYYRTGSRPALHENPIASDFDPPRAFNIGLGIAGGLLTAGLVTWIAKKLTS